jgi:hypothetical protein
MSRWVFLIFPILVFLGVFLLSRRKRTPSAKTIAILSFILVNFIVIKIIDHILLARDVPGIDFLSTSHHFEFMCLVAASIDLITLPVALVLFRQRCRIGLLSFLAALLAVLTHFLFMFVSEGFASSLLVLLSVAAVVLGIIGLLKHDGRVLAVLGLLISIFVIAT